MRHNILSGVLAYLGMTGVITGAMTVAMASPSLALAEFASHRAVYDLALAEVSPGSAVKSVFGRTAVQTQRHCDGWHLVEDYAISFEIETAGTPAAPEHTVIAHQETWENLGGTAFSFSVHENSSREPYRHYSGSAHLNGSESHAYFIADEEVSQPLPEGTVFPMAYLRQLLAAGASSEALQKATLFVGGEPDDALYSVSAFVGVHKPVAEDTAFPNLGVLSAKGYRTVRLAYYSPDSDTGVPDYEIELHIQDNGVVRSYLVDYGSYSLQGLLQELEPLDEFDC